MDLYPYPGEGDGCGGESDEASVASIGRDRVHKVGNEGLDRELDLGGVSSNNIFADDSIYTRAIMQTQVKTR
jgi:hypothetical protein